VSVRQEPNEAVEAGFVIRQLPEPGTELDEGGTVRYWVSLGPPLRVVPDLVNRTEEEVAVDLAAAELAVGEITTAPDEAVDVGRVLTWRVGDVDRPPRAAKGTAVEVVVSSGPAPRTVPPLAGDPVDQARAELEGMGLVVSTSEAFSRTVPAGSVIRTDPATGRPSHGAPPSRSSSRSVPSSCRCPM
jgi:serine/threonine-protein kinase